ncbi:MAG: alanine--tRNA ligase [Candidatus Micrarchaeota archaeon]|nr:alanine--tRNA ligase [Candidatus Micrarchaeota archaeon]
MLSKNQLREEFSKDYKRHYSTELFEQQGFERRQCPKCRKYFWAADSNRTLCGDPEHEPYSFIKEHPSHVGYEEMWSKFASFFKKNGHAVIDKYPVVSRWRQDLYFTIASIQDFQRLENGAISFEYGANPLVVPQICMRFNDIPNVGITGRHMTSFMMAGQHAFNYPKEGYWRDRTIELDYKFLTGAVGVKKDDLTYIEDVWAMGDFSEFGPCLEGFANGVELVNNVFTEFGSSDGRVFELDGKVVDVGWGFERLVWFKSGAQTAYDAIFGKQLEYIYRQSGIVPDRKLYDMVASVSGEVDFSEGNSAEAERMLISKSGIGENDYYNTIKPMQAAYAISDHCRSLLFAVSDGALPSNVGGGYNLRIILRRAFDFMEQYSLNIDMLKIMEMQAREVSHLYPGLAKNIGEIGEILKVEKERYDNTKRAARRIVESIIERKETINADRMRTLYESNGITPDFISAMARQKGAALELPKDGYTSIIKGDFIEKHKDPTKGIDIDVSGLKKTVPLYYDLATASVSKVLRSKGNMVILDKTPFYAESGGQEADTGTIGGVKVVHVKGIGGVIVHVLEKDHKFTVGSNVKCSVDKERRQRLMVHHTATHLISAASRKVLGPHAWQEGAKKSPNKAHIDIAHYEKLSQEQVAEIERTANSFIANGIKVDVDELPRSEAETKYGFSIYQGHGVPAKALRIVKISGLDGKTIDAEACGGLHLKGRESSIGMVKIISSFRIHDGINRIEFVAGQAALDFVSAMEKQIRRISEITATDQSNISAGVEQQLKELSSHREEIKRLAQEISEYIAREIGASGRHEIVKRVDHDRKILRDIATKVTVSDPKSIVMLFNSRDEIVCVSGKESPHSAVEYAKANAAKAVQGSSFLGGGSKQIAEGKISRQ